MKTIQQYEQDIWNCDTLTESQKDSACEDLNWMQTSKHYAKRVRYEKKIRYYLSLSDIFIFERSYLDLEFWENINRKLNEKCLKENITQKVNYRP